MAVESHGAAEEGRLQFEKGEVILVLEGSPEVCVCFGFYLSYLTLSSHVSAQPEHHGDLLLVNSFSIC